MNKFHPNEAVAAPVGALAFDFSLENTDGRLYQLSQAETAVALIFYRGDW